MPPRFPDTAVIGAGIIGASIAWRLAQAGRRVTLVDAGTMGGEASWAGAGMLAPGGEMETRDVWSDLGTESLALYPSFVEELGRASGVTIDFQQCGAVEIALSKEEWRALERRAAAQRGMGIPSDPLDPGELRTRIPGLAAAPAGALFYPRDTVVDPRDVIRALRIACSASGVEILEGWRAESIRCSATAVAVSNGRETITAATGVLAAGAWSGDLVVSGQAGPPLPATFPVKGHLLGYDLPPGSLPMMLRCGHTYILQRRSGFTIAGSSSERVGFDRTLDPAIVADIARRASALLPRLGDVGPSSSWIGFRPATGTESPEIRRLPGSRLWLAYGHYRNGILLAPITARMISGEIISSSETAPTSRSAPR
jgi:glycine oxidase